VPDGGGERVEERRPLSILTAAAAGGLNEMYSVVRAIPPKNHRPVHTDVAWSRASDQPGHKRASRNSVSHSSRLS
jgi:hypothetical protein